VVRESCCKLKMQLSCEVGGWCWSGSAAQESNLFIKQASTSVMRRKRWWDGLGRWGSEHLGESIGASAGYFGEVLI
jgi:hypothetical protein